MLKMGEHKSIQTDRVILVPGPEEEVEIVRWMYEAFVKEGKTSGKLLSFSTRGEFSPIFNALGPAERFTRC